MTTLGSLAHLIRSKNAGPFLLTLDVVFDDRDAFERVLRGGALNRRSIGALYAISPADVELTPYPPALAIKVTIPRAVGAGDLGDSDVYGAQQYPPLLDLPIEEG